MNNQYTFRLTLASDAFASSGDGFGTLVDADIVFDRVGLPYIPARRFKGCLKAGALEVKQIFESAGISYAFNDIFGLPGAKQSTSLVFEDLRIPKYRENYTYLDALIQKKHLHSGDILEEMTLIRQFTALENGVADPHSLRSIRVIQKGHVFESAMTVTSDAQLQALVLATQGLQELGIGAKRRRGFGKVQCELHNSQGKNVIPELLNRIEAGVA